MNSMKGQRFALAFIDVVMERLGRTLPVVVYSHGKKQRIGMATRIVHEMQMQGGRAEWIDQRGEHNSQTALIIELLAFLFLS